VIITAIRSHRKGEARLRLFLDGQPALDLSPEVLMESGVRSGQEISSRELENLRQAELCQRARARAQRYLATRPRSEFEVRTRLERYGYRPEVIAPVMEGLRSSGLIDDASFARFWKQNRISFNSRSSRLVAQELRGKGIDPEIISAVVAGIDDEVEAYRVGCQKMNSLTVADEHEFRRKLGGVLRRRGFDYGVINSTVEKLWNENKRERTEENG